MKISRLPLVGRLLDGNERLPIVQDGETRGLSLTMLLNSVAALLPPAFRGPPGGSNNTYARLEDVAANVVPEGTDLIWTANGHAYSADPAVDAAYVADNPSTSVRDLDGRGFRLAVGSGVLTVPSRAAMSRMLGVRDGTAVYLVEPGREGLFLWREGDFSGLVAADTQQGISVGNATIAPNQGAFVRQVAMPGVWHADWFGVPDDTGFGAGAVLAHNQMTAMINLANILKPSEIWLGSKIYSLGAAVPAFTFQVTLRGARGAQGTIINKRYVENDAARGVLAFGNSGFTLDKITLRATAGSGGSAISAILTQNSPAAGRTYLIDVYVSVGNYCNYSLFVNGLANTPSGGPGYRGLFIRGGEYFGAALASIKIMGAHHVMVAGAFTTNSGGASLLALDTDGNANAYNDDWQWHGVIGGQVNLKWFGGGNPGGNLGGRSQFVSPQVDNITVDANCLSTTWTGARVAGVVTNNAGAGFTTSWDGMVVARGGNAITGWRRWGDGRIEQWGEATTDASGVAANQAFPIAFTSSKVNYSAHAANDNGANIASIAQMLNGAAPGTNYTIKAYDLNYVTGDRGPSANLVRWTANGQ